MLNCLVSNCPTIVKCAKILFQALNFIFFGNNDIFIPSYLILRGKWLLVKKPLYCVLDGCTAHNIVLVSSIDEGINNWKARSLSLFQQENTIKSGCISEQKGHNFFLKVSLSDPLGTDLSPVFSSPSPSPSPRPVSDYYYKCLIYRIQASGSPQPIHFLKAHDVS